MKSFKTLFTAALAATALSAAGWAQQSGPPAPSEVIYLPQLPTAADLSKAAAAQGQTVSRIEQTNGQVTAVYTNSNGQTMVVAYQLLPNAGEAPAAGPGGQQPYAPAQAMVAQPSTPAPDITQGAPATTVVYGPDYAAYPYDYYPAYGYGYYPWYPAIGLGIGWGWGYGGWGGGYRYGWGHPGFRGAAGFHGGGFHGGAGFHGGGGGSHR